MTTTAAREKTWTRDRVMSSTAATCVEAAGRAAGSSRMRAMAMVPGGSWGGDGEQASKQASATPPSGRKIPRRIRLMVVVLVQQMSKKWCCDSNPPLHSHTTPAILLLVSILRLLLRNLIRYTLPQCQAAASHPMGRPHAGSLAGKMLAGSCVPQRLHNRYSDPPFLVFCCRSSVRRTVLYCEYTRRNDLSVSFWLAPQPPGIARHNAYPQA